MMKKPQIHLTLEEKQLEYLNAAKKKYFPLNYETMTLQDVVRAIITKDMKDIDNIDKDEKREC